MQGLLELAELPYVGAGVLGSSLAMDKDVLKRICRERGLPVVEHVVVLRSRMDLDSICRSLSFPVFVKPANLGSSVGISKARNREELRAALELAAMYDRKIIVERAIDGRELECSVLGNDDPVASRPCEVLPSREFYDYEDKYLCDSAQFKLPAELTPAETAEVRRLAVECYRAVECEGMARVDFFLEKGTGRHLHQRDQHHPRLHVDQHVPAHVGQRRHGLPQFDRPAYPTRARAPPGPQDDSLQQVRMFGFLPALFLLAAPAQDIEAQIRRFAEAVRGRGARCRRSHRSLQGGLRRAPSPPCCGLWTRTPSFFDPSNSISSRSSKTR